MSGEAMVRALVNFDRWSYALEGNVAGMMSCELAAFTILFTLMPPGSHPDIVGYTGRGATPYTLLWVWGLSTMVETEFDNSSDAAYPAHTLHQVRCHGVFPGGLQLKRV